MEAALRILFILLVGLIAKHAIQRVFTDRLRPRHCLNVWCIYGIAGCTALGVKLALRQLTDLHSLIIALLFGVVWGLAAGILTATARRTKLPASQEG